MDTTNSYQFVRLSDENIHLLVDLYKHVFNVSYTLQQIKNKYQPDYTGIHAQGHFAFFKDKPVAFHGAIPVIMNYRGQKELCAQYGDAMTLKEHAGNGLFTTLGKLTDIVLQEKGVRFVWGFPNQNSEYGYVNKLSWEGEKRMKCYIFKIRSVSSEVVLRKTKILENKNQERIKEKLSSILVEKKDLESIDKRISGGIDRSPAFYRYKSFSPNYFIDLVGTKVWVKPKGGLLVGDFEVRNDKQVSDTIENLKNLARGIGLNKVVIQASPDSNINRSLEKHHSSIDSWLIGYKNFNSRLPLHELQFTYGDLDTF